MRVGTKPIPRLPTSLVGRFPVGALAIWLYARALDPAGSGWARFTIAKAAAQFNRTERSIHRMLRAAALEGLLTYYTSQGGEATCHYTSLIRAAAVVGLDELGQIVEISLDELRVEALSLIATEATAEHLQRKSFHAEQMSQKESGSNQTVPSVAALTSDAANQSSGFRSGALACSDRWLELPSEMPTYGASQESIAALRGVSTRTVQNHLSNGYRAKFDTLEPIWKRQTAKPVAADAEGMKAAARMSGSAREAGRWFYDRKTDRSYLCGCNLYACQPGNVRLRFQRVKHSPEEQLNLYGINRDDWEVLVEPYPHRHTVPARWLRKRFQRILTQATGREPQKLSS